MDLSRYPSCNLSTQFCISVIRSRLCRCRRDTPRTRRWTWNELSSFETLCTACQQFPAAPLTQKHPAAPVAAHSMHFWEQDAVHDHEHSVAVSRNSFHHAWHDHEHNVAVSRKSLLVVSFPHLRICFWVWDSVSDNVLLQFPAAPSTLFCLQFPAAPQTEPESNCRFSGILETSGPQEEDCPLFKLAKIKHTDLGFASAGSPSVFLLNSLAGFWCPHIWFESWGPSWFYQTTNLTPLCGS